MVAPQADDYFARAQAMLAKGPIPDAPDSGILLSLGFALAETAVDVAIVGTRSPRNMAQNIAWVENALPIRSATVQALQERFAEVEENWVQLM